MQPVIYKACQHVETVSISGAGAVQPCTRIGCSAPFTGAMPLAGFIRRVRTIVGRPEQLPATEPAEAEQTLVERIMEQLEEGRPIGGYTHLSLLNQRTRVKQAIGRLIFNLAPGA